MTFVSLHLFWFLAIFGCYRIVTNQNRRGKRGWKIVFEKGPWTQPTNKRLKSAWLSICLELIFLFIYYFYHFFKISFALKSLIFWRKFVSKDFSIFGKFFEIFGFLRCEGMTDWGRCWNLKKTWNRMLSISI